MFEPLFADFGWIDGLWWFTIAGSALLYFLVYTNEALMVRLNSNPWAFELKRNLDLDYQGVMYAAYHTTFMGRLSHSTLLADATAWMMVIITWEPALMMPALLVFIWQTWQLGDRSIAIVGTVSWLLITVAALGLLGWLGQPLAYDVARVFLMSTALFRFIGHAWEPIPPLIGADHDRFIEINEMNFSPSHVLLPITGYISEFCSGLPYRLVCVHFAFIAYKIKHTFADRMNWEQNVEVAKDIHRSGWRAWAPMGELVSKYLPESERDTVTQTEGNSSEAASQ